MGLLFIGVLAGILLGWFASADANYRACALPGCVQQSAAAQAVAPRTATLTERPPAAKVKSATAAKSRERHANRSSRHADRGTRAGRPSPGIAPASSEAAAEKSDPVLDKAKVAVKAKMEQPATAQFADMNRAYRLNTFGRAVDTVCGHVKGKDALGGDTGDRPFLYLVKEDEAYVVNGKKESAATIAYRNICS